MPLLAACLLLALAACTSTVTRTEAKADARATPAPPDAESLKRSAGVRLELASLYFSRGQFNTALDEIKLAIQADPNNGAAYNLSGLIYAALGNMAQADASFQRALQINPRDADTMNNYGWVLCQNQRYKEADVQFQQALVQPNYRGAAQDAARDGDLPGARQPAGRCRSLADALLPDRPEQRRDGSTPWPMCSTAAASTTARASTSTASTSRPSSPTRRRCGWRARIEYKLGNRALALRPGRPAAQALSAVAGNAGLRTGPLQ